MTDNTFSARVAELYNKLEEAIDNEDIGRINSCYEKVQYVENEFLSSYTKRKKEGVYYTPSELSDFMVNEALIEFLRGKSNKIAPEITNVSALMKLVRSKPDIYSKVSNMISKLTFFDPACGSGIFLQSALKLKLDLLNKLGKNIQHNSEILLEIVKSLFGNDINSNALKLCKIKLLSCIPHQDRDSLKEILSVLNKNIAECNSLLELDSEKYDIIVGNPPYGNILTSEEKLILKKQDIFYKDIYCSFLLKSIEWSQKGIISFLVPKSFLLRQGYIKLREKLTSSTDLLKIYDIGPNIFKLATNEVQIMVYTPQNTKEHNLRIYDYPDHKVIYYAGQNFDDLRICRNKECPLCDRAKKFYAYSVQKRCPYCKENTLPLNRIRIKPSEEILRLISNIEMSADLNYLNVRDFPQLIRGEEDKGLKEVKNHLKRHLNQSCEFVSARNDFTYYHLNPQKSFTLEDISPDILKGNDYEYYKGPKLLIKHNNIIPEAVYTEETVCFTSSIYSLLCADTQELKFLSALLNSALLQFYCIYGINNQKNTTINLNQYMIRHLPIMFPQNTEKVRICENVNEIILGYENNDGQINNQIRLCTKNIDQLIFDLYGLTTEQQKLVLSKVNKSLNYFKEIYS